MQKRKRTKAARTKTIEEEDDNNNDVETLGFVPGARLEGIQDAWSAKCSRFWAAAQQALQTVARPARVMPILLPGSTWHRLAPWKSLSDIVAFERREGVTWGPGF